MVVVDTQTLTTMSWFVDSESRASEEARVSPTRCRNDGNKRTRKKKQKSKNTHHWTWLCLDTSALFLGQQRRRFFHVEINKRPTAGPRLQTRQTHCIRWSCEHVEGEQDKGQTVYIRKRRGTGGISSSQPSIFLATHLLTPGIHLPHSFTNLREPTCYYF